MQQSSRAKRTSAAMTVTATKPPKYLTLNDLCLKLRNRSRSSIYTDFATGQLPKPFKIGGRLYWIEEEVDEHIRALRDGDGAELI